MINIFEVNETNKMIGEQNLDVRTITLGISLLDCVSDDIDTLCDNIYNKITHVAKDLVSTGKEIELEFGIPIDKSKGIKVDRIFVDKSILDINSGYWLYTDLKEKQSEYSKYIQKYGLQGG